MSPMTTLLFSDSESPLLHLRREEERFGFQNPFATYWNDYTAPNRPLEVCCPLFSWWLVQGPSAAFQGTVCSKKLGPPPFLQPCPNTWSLICGSRSIQIRSKNIPETPAERPSIPSACPDANWLTTTVNSSQVNSQSRATSSSGLSWRSLSRNS